MNTSHKSNSRVVSAQEYTLTQKDEPLGTLPAKSVEHAADAFDLWGSAHNAWCIMGAVSVVLAVVYVLHVAGHISNGPPTSHLPHTTLVNADSSEQPHAATLLAHPSHVRHGVQHACTPTPHMPPGISGLCAVTHASAWEQLRVFFSSAAPKLKVYVADVHGEVDPGNPRHGSMANEVCTKRVQHCVKTFGDREAMASRVGVGGGAFPYCREFGAEQLLPASFAMSPFATDKPGDADLVLANACIMGNGMQGQHQPAIAELLLGKTRNDPHCLVAPSTSQY